MSGDDDELQAFIEELKELFESLGYGIYGAWIPEEDAIDVTEELAPPNTRR